MSLTKTYEDDNIFAKIIRGEMPKVAVYEDGNTLAFMDAFPQSEGHILVVSKTSKAVNLIDLEPVALGIMMATVQMITRGVVKALNPDGVRVVQFNGEAAGQTVFHTHFHIIPIYQGKKLGRHGEGMADAADLKAIAEKVRHVL